MNVTKPRMVLTEGLRQEEGAVLFLFILRQKPVTESPAFAFEGVGDLTFQGISLFFNHVLKESQFILEL